MIRHLVLFAVAIVFFLPAAHAGKVVNVKGKKVYIVFDSTEGGTFAEGDSFNLTDASTGKKKALIQIRKVKGLKAIAQLRKGKAAKGDGTIFKSAKGGSGALAENEDSGGSTSSSSSFGKMQSRWGAMFGYSSAGQDVDQGDDVSNQTGSSMAVRGVYDYPLIENVTLRSMGGVELFSVSGLGEPLSSTAQTTVGTDITYIALDGLAKWDFWTTNSMKVHAFLGAGFLYPMSTSSDVIVEDSIEMVVVGELGVGVDIKWGKWIIPVHVNYIHFPDGEDVKTTLYGVKAGILF